jgi:2-dehydro-3-deoxy-D-arabinonate dehydratase
MYLTRHQTESGPCWAFDGRFLPIQCNLALLMQLPASRLAGALETLVTSQPTAGRMLPPVEPQAEIWASGVTYLRSRDARGGAQRRISTNGLPGERPELFKATGGRAVGPGGQIRIRRDSAWNVPEPELVLVANAAGRL